MMRSVVLGGSSVRWDQRGIVRPCAGCVCGFGVWGDGESDCACELHWGKGDEDMQEAKTTSTWQPARLCIRRMTMANPLVVQPVLVVPGSCGCS